MEDLTIEIEDDMLNELRALAKVRGCPPEELARRIITEAVVPERTVVPPREESAATAFERLRNEAGGGVDIDLPDRFDWKQRSLDLSA